MCFKLHSVVEIRLNRLHSESKRYMGVVVVPQPLVIRIFHVPHILFSFPHFVLSIRAKTRTNQKKKFHSKFGFFFASELIF